MVAQVVNNNGTLELRNLAGGSSDGLPVGSILAIHDTRVPYGFLPCNGSTYDINQYPALYTVLHSNRLPDLREMNLVGIGSNSTANIATHDTYTLGQFKDDQTQETITGVRSTAESTVTDPGHCHSVTQNVVCDDAGNVSGLAGAKLWRGAGFGICSCSATTGISVDTSVTSTLEANANARTGYTTHGKNYGVFFVIKAVTGAVDIDDATVYAQVVDLLECNYIQKSLFSDGGIPMYNSTTECFDQITPPAQNGLALSYDVTNCCYCWGETASAVANLTDVCLTNLSDCQYLQYNSTSCTWNNVSESWNCSSLMEVGLAGYTGYEKVYSTVAKLVPNTGTITTSFCTDSYYNCCVIIAPSCICYHSSTNEYGSETNFLIDNTSLCYRAYSTDSFNYCCGGLCIDSRYLCLKGNCNACYNFQTGAFNVCTLNATTVCASGDICSSNFCLSCLKDACISSVACGQTLVYNGTKWVNCAGASSNCISDNCTSYVKVTGNQVDICSAGSCMICFKGTCSACYDPSNGTLCLKNITFI